MLAVLLYKIRIALLPFVFAIAVAFVFDPLIKTLQRRLGMPRWPIAAALYLLLLMLLAAAGYRVLMSAVPAVIHVVAHAPDILHHFLGEIISSRCWRCWPEDIPLRGCTCSFCRSHSPRIVADPEGFFEVWADDWSLVENYRFGTRTCDFLICRRCGVFIAAVSQIAEGTGAVVNVNCLSDRGRFTSIPVLHDFEGEAIETRTSRRAANWMPASIRR